MCELSNERHKEGIESEKLVIKSLHHYFLIVWQVGFEFDVDISSITLPLTSNMTIVLMILVFTQRKERKSVSKFIIKRCFDCRSLSCSFFV